MHMEAFLVHRETGVPWQAVLMNIIDGGAVIRVEGQADQREDQGL